MRSSVLTPRPLNKLLLQLHRRNQNCKDILRPIHVSENIILKAGAQQNANGSSGGNEEPAPRRRGRPRRASNSPSDPAPSTKDEIINSISESQDELHLLKSDAHDIRRKRGRPRKHILEDAKTVDGINKAVRSVGRPRSNTPLTLKIRDSELRTVIVHTLELQPEEFKPTRASWCCLVSSTLPTTLVTRLHELEEALGRPMVARMAQRHPHLLKMTTPHLLSRLSALNLLLGVPRAQLLAAVRGFPALLAYRPEGVGTRVVTLVQELGKSADYVAAMALSQPVLLGMSPATLRYRVGLLHEAASLLPNKWGVELSSLRPASMGRILRCSDVVLQRLLYTYLRTATNGRRFHRIRSLTTITCLPAGRWNEENPLFREWLAAGEADRRDGLTAAWPGWYRRAGEVDWWEERGREGNGEVEGEEEEGEEGSGLEEEGGSEVAEEDGAGGVGGGM